MWYDQVQLLHDDIIAHQEVPTYSLNESGDFEGRDGVDVITISVNTYIETVETILARAKTTLTVQPQSFEAFHEQANTSKIGILFYQNRTILNESRQTEF